MNYNWSYKDLDTKVEKILKFLRDKKIISYNISFSIIKSKEKKAYVTKTNEIIITDSLFNYLVSHMKDALDLLCIKSESIKKIDDEYSITFNKKEKDVSKEKIFDLWFNFIFFQEISHIIRNHFKALKHKEIAEFHLREKITDRFFLEIDADRIASAMLAPYIANKKDLIVFLESSGYLFHLLYQIDKEENYYQNDYLHPFIRLLFFHQNIYQFSQFYLPLNMKFDLNNILASMEKLFIMNQQYYTKEMIEDGLKIKEYRKQYNNFIKKNIEILTRGFQYKDSDIETKKI